MEKIFSHLSSDDYQSVKNRLKKAADDEGLPFGNRVMAFNSRLAQELGKWAESRGLGDEFHHAVFRSYLVDGKNIGKISVLVETAVSAGLPGAEAEKVLKNRMFKKDVDEDWSLTQKNSITAAPSFILNKEKLVGAQPYEILEKFLETNGVKKRTGSH